MPKAKRKDPKEEARQRFVNGTLDKWNAGEYGYTVNCIVKNHMLKLKFTSPTRRQWTLPGEGDTQERRKLLTELAMRHVLEWRTGALAERTEARRRTEKVSPPRESAISAGPTCGEVWRRYIQDRWPSIGDDFAGWGRPEVRQYYKNLSPDDRLRAPSPDSLFPVLQCMCRVTAFASYAPEVLISDLEPGDWTQYTNWRRTHPDGKQANGEPYSYGTIATDFGRYHTAIKHCRVKYRRSWSGTSDPLEGAEVVRIKAELEEIGEQRAQMITRTLREGKQWRALGAVMFAGGSGRRIGAIGADRHGIGADGLRATDFEVIEGRLCVTWRAEAAKGKGFGRGDETLPATRSMAVAYRWLRRFHGNPLGPEHPLLWSPEDPTVPVSYAALSSSFKKAWQQALGQKAPRGVAFHAYCRTVVTTLVDALGASQAAEYTGRTVKTIEAHYKRKRATTQVRSMEVIDRMHAEAAATIDSERDANRNRKSQPGSPEAGK